MRILLACVAGMSTSLLVEKMKKEVVSRGLDDLVLKAEPIEGLSDVIDDYDIVLLGPQARFKEKMVAELCNNSNKKYAVIPYQIYGLVDGAKTLDLALSLAKR
jgi:PTS system cellobiose-specific IIB component